MRFDEILSEIGRRGLLRKVAGAAGVAGLGALGVSGYNKLKPKTSEYDKPAEPTDIEETVDAIRRAQLQAAEYQKIAPKIISPARVYDKPQIPLLRAFLRAKSSASAEELAQFLAQCHAETGKFISLDEKLGWNDLERFYNTFKKKLLALIKWMKQQGDKHLSDNHEQEAYEHARKLIASPDEYKRQIIANSVYANRYGNGPPESGDGWNYRGKGFIHITYKDNYREMGGETLVNNPDLLLTNLDWAMFAAVNFWLKKVAPTIRDWNNTAAVTKIVNSGESKKGVDSRDRLFREYLRKMPELLREVKQYPKKDRGLKEQIDTYQYIDKY